MVENITKLVKNQKSFSKWFLNEGRGEQLFSASKETLAKGDVGFLHEVAVNALVGCTNTHLFPKTIVGVVQVCGMETASYAKSARVAILKMFKRMSIDSCGALVVKPVDVVKYKIQVPQWGRRRRVVELFNDFWAVPHDVFIREDPRRFRGWVANILPRGLFSVRCWMRYVVVRRPAYLRTRYHKYLFYTRRVWLRQKFVLNRKNRRVWFGLLRVKLALLGVSLSSKFVNASSLIEKGRGGYLRKFLKVWFYEEHFYRQLWGWGKKRFKHIGFGRMNFILFRVWISNAPLGIQKQIRRRGWLMSRYVIKEKVFNYSTQQIKVQEVGFKKSMAVLNTIKSCAEFEAGRGRKRWFRRQLYGFLSRHLLDIYLEEALPFLIPENDWFVLFEKRVFSVNKYYFDKDIYLE